MNVDDLDAFYRNLIPFKPSIYDVEEYDEDGNFYLFQAVKSIIEVFPDDYVLALKAARSGEDYNKVFLTRLEDRGIILDTLSEAKHGIPILCTGSYFDDQSYIEGPQQDGTIWEVVVKIWDAVSLNAAMFDQVSGYYETGMRNMEILTEIVDHLAGSREERQSERILTEVISPSERLGWFIAWVFSITGCGPADMTEESFFDSGLVYDDWTVNGLRWAVELLEYRDKIMEFVESSFGLYDLDEDGFFLCLQKAMEEPERCSEIVISWLNSVVSLMESSSESDKTEPSLNTPLIQTI